MSALNGPLQQHRKKIGWYWFTGNGSTSQTLYEGMGVCLNSDLGTATADDAKRGNTVELPKDGNDLHFVGVLSRDYTIPADGTFVEVNEPGSVCVVRCKTNESTTINSTILVCVQDTGLWEAYGSETGKGTARCLQTITGGAAALDCLVVLEEGVQSGLQAD